jgi:large subunit ribosomal protein L21
MNYAVIRVNKNQYKVREGEEILVDKIKENKLTPEVLFAHIDDKIFVGKPIVGEVKVLLKKLEDIKGKKVEIQIYKAKSRYRRRMGFRPSLSKLLVEKIK